MLGPFLSCVLEMLPGMRFAMSMVLFRPVLPALVFLAGFGGVRLACAQAAPGVAAAPAQAAPARPAPTPEQLAIQAASEKDHQRMMDLLGIKALAARGQRQRRRAQRGQLRRIEGGCLHQPARSAGAQERRKGDVGRRCGGRSAGRRFRRTSIARSWAARPPILPKVTWEVVSTTQEKNGDVAVVTKRLLGHVDNSAWPAIKVDIDLTLTTPADAKGPVPVIMEFGFSREFMAQMAKRFPQLAAGGQRRTRARPGSSRCWRRDGVMRN